MARRQAVRPAVELVVTDAKRIVRLRTTAAPARQDLGQFPRRRGRSSGRCILDVTGRYKGVQGGVMDPSFRTTS